uniref:Uncharacterized protein n=1 Tax=Arundo donax TaxID=35708 RepID=A0A0A9HJU3_ARUDO
MLISACLDIISCCKYIRPTYLAL